ncbi:MAG TPA: hypothetical protein PLF42_11475, partial [Anaerolineales bacterium]|nr:hypothetical protein [Anaerolineales bacterium]
PEVFAPGAFTVTALLFRVLLLAGFYWAWSSFGAFREELAETNRSGRILAAIAVLVVLFATYLSMFLLTY